MMKYEYANERHCAQCFLKMARYEWATVLGEVVLHSGACTRAYLAKKEQMEKAARVANLKTVSRSESTPQLGEKFGRP